MSEVIVDTEKLAYGLERGIGYTDTIWASVPSENRLRLAPCGLVSSSIHNYSTQNDIPSQEVIVSADFGFDSGEHVLPLLGETNQDRVAVDASYSQFLGYVGLSLGYEECANVKVFPPEKILKFKLSETDLILDWLTIVAYEFRKLNTHPKDEFGLDVGRGPLTRASAARIRQTFTQIWNPSNYKLWTPPERVQRHGKTVSRHIPKDAIVIP